MKSFSLAGLVRGIILSAITFLALTSAFSIIALRFDDPEEYLSLFSGMVLAVSAFAGAMAVSKKNGKMTCLSFTLLYLLIFWAVGSVLSDGMSFSFIKAVIIVLSAFAGCVIRKGNSGTASSARRRKNVQKRYRAYR